jgi:hypothetical protein
MPEIMLSALTMQLLVLPCFFHQPQVLLLDSEEALVAAAARFVW